MKKYMFLLKPAIFFISILIGAYTVLWIEKVRPSDFGFYKDIFKKEVVIKKRKSYPLRKYNDTLTAQDMKIARIAWRYFENNYIPATGFVNSVDKYPGTTLWDVTSYLHALTSAYEIGVIDTTEFDTKLKTILTSMSKMKLFKDMLPNKSYNTYNLAMIDYENHPTEEGIGWSAMDIGRFFSFTYRLMKDYPAYFPNMKAVISRWKIDEIIDDATLHGIGFSFKDKRMMKVQEGKLGYEEYIAKGYDRMGFDVSEALKYTDFIKFVKINGVDIAADTREVKYFPAYNYILSEPYILDGIEYGWDLNSKELAYRVYLAQKRKADKENKIIAVSEGHLDTFPYFVYNSVYTNKEKWVCVSSDGEKVNDKKTFSTKAAFAWYTLFDDDYSQKLYKKVLEMADENKGFYSGYYQKTGKINKALTANTNGVILECLRYKKSGPINRLENRTGKAL